MIYNKMLVVPKYRVNRWDKDSIRPGPVGTVGDVNVQVQLRKSSPDMPNRYDPTFSGKNASWSGSNISDGMWHGWTSGGREGTVISKALPNNQTGGKTNIGWVMQNIVPTDRSSQTKVTPLGRYGWDTTVGNVLRSKTTGDLFLPLTDPFEKPPLPRGSQFPTVVQESIGQGVPLPAADVPLTDPVFGDTGTIELPGYDYPSVEIPGEAIPGTECPEDKLTDHWAPTLDDPERKKRLHIKSGEYLWRHAWINSLGRYDHDMENYPDVGPNVLAFYMPTGGYAWRPFSGCGLVDRPADVPPNKPEYYPPVTRPGGSVPPRKIPEPGNQDKRRQDRKKEQEDEKRKKQKMR